MKEGVFLENTHHGKVAGIAQAQPGVSDFWLGKSTAPDVLAGGR